MSYWFSIRPFPCRLSVVLRASRSGLRQSQKNALRNSPANRKKYGIPNLHVNTNYRDNAIQSSNYLATNLKENQQFSFQQNLHSKKTKYSPKNSNAFRPCEKRKSNHSNAFCSEYQLSQPIERYRIGCENSLCTNCFNKKHRKQTCLSAKRC